MLSRATPLPHIVPVFNAVGFSCVYRIIHYLTVIFRTVELLQFFLHQSRNKNIPISIDEQFFAHWREYVFGYSVEMAIRSRGVYSMPQAHGMGRNGEGTVLALLLSSLLCARSRARMHAVR